MNWYGMAGPRTSSDYQRTDPATWLDQYGDVLYGYALLRVRRQDLAEDLVQETLLAAIEARDRFEARSSERTWLVSILRRKIVDYFRRAQRIQLEVVNRGEEAHFFDAKGRRKFRVRKWRGDPQQTLERKEFWHTLEQCLSQLPRAVANTFVLKELDRLASEEICNELDITPSNLSVRLHRARLLLQQCLERHWFSSNEQR